MAIDTINLARVRNRRDRASMQVSRIARYLRTDRCVERLRSERRGFAQRLLNSPHRVRYLNDIECDGRLAPEGGRDHASALAASSQTVAPLRLRLSVGLKSALRSSPKRA